jgi:copper chaperone CopZ
MAAPAPRTTTLQIDDMPAVHAVRAVEFALGGVPGVLGVEVTRGRAEVTHEAAVSPEALAAAVRLAGCTVRAAVTRRVLPVR